MNAGGLILKGNNVFAKEETSAYCYGKDIKNYISTISDESTILKCKNIVDKLDTIANDMTEASNQGNNHRYQELSAEASSVYNEFLDILISGK